MPTTVPVPALLDLLDESALTRIDVADLLAHTRALVRDEIDDVLARRSTFEPVIPTIEFDELDSLDDADRVEIRRRGCVVVRNTFERAEAEAWDHEIGRYLETNRFNEVFAARHPEAVEDGSRIWGIYWSKPQVRNRQHTRMVAVRRFLGSFWNVDDPAESGFDPDHDIAYPDRLRRRAPGVTARGLRPHCDAPAAGGWRVPENHLVFAEVLAGHPERYDPFDATHRIAVNGPSPVSCTAFRTFQGWTALSEMHPTDGVLHLAPVPTAMAYLLVAGIAGELGLDGEPTPAPRRSGADDLLVPALTPIPLVEPGDTVWWHGDVVHSVGEATNDSRWGNVMYAGASPRCPRNEAYRSSMLDRFERGLSPLDFPDEHFEVDFVGRATVADLDRIGREQFGLDPTGKAVVST